MSLPCRRCAASRWDRWRAQLVGRAADHVGEHAHKALVAVEHSITTAIWHMLNDSVPYHRLGGCYFTQRDPERAARRAVSRLNELGHRVTLDPMEAAG